MDSNIIDSELLDAHNLVYGNGTFSLFIVLGNEELEQKVQDILVKGEEVTDKKLGIDKLYKGKNSNRIY